MILCLLSERNVVCPMKYAEMVYTAEEHVYDTVMIGMENGERVHAERHLFYAMMKERESGAKYATEKTGR